MGISKEERNKRFARGQESARESLAAKEIFSLRLKPETIKSIYDLAAEQKIHASDLVRGWIESHVSSDNTKAKGPEDSKSELISAVRYAVREELTQIVSELKSDRNKHL